MDNLNRFFLAISIKYQKGYPVTSNRSTYVSTLQQSCDGLFIYLRQCTTHRFFEQDASFDIASAAKMSIEKYNSSTIVELKLENMKITPQMLDVCAANLEALIQIC